METLNIAGVRALGFIGLGVMGAPMAGHLLKSGLRVLAYNRTAAKAQAWRARFPNGETCDRLSELAQSVDVLALCVGNDNDVRETVTAMLPHLKKGAVIKNSILMQGVSIGENCTMDHVILDKSVTVREGRTLTGYDGFPIILKKGTTI